MIGSAQSSKPPPITKEVLELRLGALERDRAQAIANVNAYDGAIQEVKYWIALLRVAEEKEKAIAEFPKVKYCGDLSITVQNKEEEKALEKCWVDAPPEIKEEKH